MPKLYRSMKDDGSGKPEVSPTARRLGVRPGGGDVAAVLPSDLVNPGQGGMSVSPDTPLNLAVFRRPAQFQGTGKDPVWEIDSAALLLFDLSYRVDPKNPKHGHIEPTVPMALDDYQRRLAATQSKWRPAWPAGGVTMTLLDQVEKALRADNPLRQLRAVAVEHLSGGMGRQELLDALEGVRAVLRSQGREADEDTVMEQMDIVADYCSPHMKIEL
jgi:hypothetical protein